MKKINRLLYTSLVDISIPYGPGVNERGFIKDMANRFGSNFKAIIPRPSNGLPSDLYQADITYLNYSKSSRNFLGWIESRLVGSLLLQLEIRNFRPDFMVMRLGALSLPQFFAACFNYVPFALKTFGSGSFKPFYDRNHLSIVTAGLNEYIQDKMLSKCVMIDVTNNMLSASLAEAYPVVNNRLHIIDNGADLDMFAAGNGASIRQRNGVEVEDFLLGYVGAFPMKRGGKEVVDLVKQLHTTFRVKGLIVGDSGDADECRRYANERGVAELVSVVGKVSYEEVPNYMDAMDIGLSILRKEERCASEQKVRQYIASGLCVIGTQGSNDFLRDFDFARVVSDVSPKEIEEAARSLLDEGHAGFKRRAMEARKFAQNELSIASKNDHRLRLWSEYLLLWAEEKMTPRNRHT